MSVIGRNGPDITWPARVSELPKELFTSKELFESELEVIFYGRQWHAVAHVAEIPLPGDFKTFEVGRVALLVIRGTDGAIRVFLNSCTHRGTQLATAPSGNTTSIECPYHRWLFRIEGELVSCPGMDDFPKDFDRKDYALKQVRMTEFMGLIFVTFSPDTPDLEESLGPKVREVLSIALQNGAPLRLVGYQKTQYSCNWKGYTDNDAYHAPLLHTGFRLLGWQGGKGAQYATSNGHGAVLSQLKPARNSGFLNDPSLIAFRSADPDRGSAAATIFPMTQVVAHMDIINVRFGIAKSAHRTDVHYAYFARADDDESMVRHRVQQASNLLGPCGMVSMEDVAVFARIHVGCGTPGTVAFQKGVHEDVELGTEFKQNDEAANVPRWEYYRQIMGFERLPS